MRTSRLASNNPLLPALGQVVRALRVEQELTQGALAEKAGIHFTWVSHIESGRVNPTISNLTRLSEGLGVKLSELIRLAEELAQ
jgi:transcriptional regulator with XRE-family HTH domain